MLKDLRFGVRMLLRQPGFTLIAVLTLALGIGATSAVFSLIQGVLLTPPPYRQPDRLVLIPAARTDGQADAHSNGWAAAHWLDWQAQAKSFDSIGAYGWTFNFMVRNDGSESMEGMWVTPDYFRALGIQPILGRTFLDSETGANANAGDHSRLRPLAAHLPRRPAHPRQDRTDQPLEDASHGDRRDASRRSLPSRAVGLPGA